MIIRALHLRHGRIALPRSLTPIYSQQRQQSSLETSTSTDRLDAPSFVDIKNSSAQQQLDALSLPRPIQLNDPDHPVAKDYAFFQHQKAHTQHLGASQTPHYKPHTLVNNPPSPKDITLELLLASQAHIGHATSLWHPANARYIFGIRGRKKVGESPIHIISLEATAAHLRRACKVVTGVTERGGLVLFVGTREGQARAVVKAAQLSKGCHLFTKWIPGSITNGQQILGRCATKVVDEFDREVEGFEDQLATKSVLKPDLVVCLNPLENYVLLHECGLNNIPTIGIIDTDANPTWVTYPIPANDDSLRSVQVIAGVLGRAGEQGQANRQRMAKSGLIMYSPAHGLSAPDTSRTSSRKKLQKQARPTRQAIAPPPSAAASLPTPDVQPISISEAMTPTSTTTSEQPLDNLDDSDIGDEDFSLVEDAEDTVYSAKSELDPSLTDDSYTGDISEEDINQFGGVEQLQSSSNAIGEVDDADQELGAASGGESPLEQVEEVQQELGEHHGSEPPVGNPEASGENGEQQK